MLANDMADISAEDLQPTLAEGGETAMAALVEKTIADPGAPFASEIAPQLAELKKVKRGAFEALRAQLKKGGCRVIELDNASR